MNACKQTSVSSLSLCLSLTLDNIRTRSYTTKKWLVDISVSLFIVLWSTALLYNLELETSYETSMFINVTCMIINVTSMFLQHKYNPQNRKYKESKKLLCRIKNIYKNTIRIKKHLFYLNKFYSHCFSVAFSSFA